MSVFYKVLGTMKNDIKTVILMIGSGTVASLITDFFKGNGQHLKIIELAENRLKAINKNTETLEVGIEVQKEIRNHQGEIKQLLTNIIDSNPSGSEDKTKGEEGEKGLIPIKMPDKELKELIEQYQSKSKIECTSGSEGKTKGEGGETGLILIEMPKEELKKLIEQYQSKSKIKYTLK